MHAAQRESVLRPPRKTGFKRAPSKHSDGELSASSTPTSAVLHCPATGSEFRIADGGSRRNGLPAMVPLPVLEGIARPFHPEPLALLVLLLEACPHAVNGPSAYMDRCGMAGEHARMCAGGGGGGPGERETLLIPCCGRAVQESYT